MAQLRTAVALIPAPTEIVEISGARHDLARPEVPAFAVSAALRLSGSGNSGTVDS